MVDPPVAEPQTPDWFRSAKLKLRVVRSQLIAGEIEMAVVPLGTDPPPRHDALRVLEQVVGEVADLVAEGGREQQALLVLGHQGQDLLDVVDEAHVQHAVGFVQHQQLDGGQVEKALLLQVEQAAGGGHQDVDATFHGVDLRVHAHTAEDHRGGQRVFIRMIDIAAGQRGDGHFLAPRGQPAHVPLGAGEGALGVLAVGAQDGEAVDLQLHGRHRQPLGRESPLEGSPRRRAGQRPDPGPRQQRVQAAPPAGTAARQQRVAGVPAPAGTVDQALRVLDAKAQRKRFGLHGHTMAVQHGEGVARAVAQRHHHVAGGQCVVLAICSVFDL